MSPRRPENALVVRTFAYPTTVEGNGPDDDGVVPLPGAQVKITQGPPAPLGPRSTDAGGEVRFNDLDAATNYQITVVAPPNYRAPTQLFRNGVSQALNQDIVLRRGDHVVVQVGMAPVAGRVQGTITVPPGTNPAGLQVEARIEGRLIDRATAAAKPRTAKTTWAYRLDIDEPGVVEVRPSESFESAGRLYVPRSGDVSRLVTVPPGGIATVDLAYVPSSAEVRLGAQVVDDVDGRRERHPLRGVTFKLFELGKDRPLRESTTQSDSAVVFPDVPEGSYRVVAVPPRGPHDQRLQLARPSGREVTLTVADGQPVDLTNQFVFQPARGSIVGSVVIDQDDTPVPGVAVLVTAPHLPQSSSAVVTDADGEFRVEDLPEGSYQVALAQPVVTALGRRWEQALPSGADGGVRTVQVAARGVATADFRLVEEQHVVSGRVLGPGDTGAPHVIVQVLRDTDPATDPIANVLTDEHGRYEFAAPTAGTYFLRVYQDNGVAPRLVGVTVNSRVVAQDLRLQDASDGSAAASRSARASQQGSLDSDFPFLTEEVDLSERGGTAQPAGGGGAVGRVVERQIRDVLGWRPRPNDPKGFQAALQQAFTVREVAGHTEVEWRPRSYSVDIQADLGALTGAQASIYTRAKGTLDAVLPLLDGLTPLRTDSDDENVSAIRAIVRSQLTELVGELGVEGGPRVRRVDQLFDFLLVDPSDVDRWRREYASVRTSRDPADVGGSLGVLRDRLGLVRGRINTIDEEQNFTNFLVVLDHVAGLKESWDAQRQFFVRDAPCVEPFLGTQLVLLSRDLEVIAESVHEVEYAMDSVFLGPAERQTLELTFPRDSEHPAAGSPPLFVAELLGWVEQFASEEGRHLIEEGGRQGVVAFRPTLELLQHLVEAALVESNGGLQDPDTMPAAYRRQRVQRALQELAQQLGAAFQRVEQFQAPVEDAALRSTRTTPSQPTRPAGTH